MTLTTFEPPTIIELDDNFHMAYREWGRPDAAQTAVLVHGITSSSLSWPRVARGLADRYRVLAVDLRGHGDSDKPGSGYRLQDQANEVAQFCGALGLRRVALMGHSWGGAIGLILAATTDLVERLVLEDPALGIGQPPQPSSRPRPNYVATVGVSREEAERQARANLALGWTEEDVAGKVDAAVKASPAAVQAVFDENSGRALDLSTLVAKITCPALMVQALPANGGVVSPEALAIVQTNPHFRVVTLDDADHNIHRGRFDAFMSAVAPFM
jgi:pimeloyl-ACP methyl ester carboxylesterase